MTPARLVILERKRRLLIAVIMFGIAVIVMIIETAVTVITSSIVNPARLRSLFTIPTPPCIRSHRLIPPRSLAEKQERFQEAKWLKWLENRRRGEGKESKKTVRFYPVCGFECGEIE